MDRDADRGRTVVRGSLHHGGNNFVRLNQGNKGCVVAHAVYDSVRVLDEAVSTILSET